MSLWHRNLPVRAAVAVTVCFSFACSGVASFVEHTIDRNSPQFLIPPPDPGLSSPQLEPIPMPADLPIALGEGDWQALVSTQFEQTRSVRLVRTGDPADVFEPLALAVRAVGCVGAQQTHMEALWHIECDIEGPHALAVRALPFDATRTLVQITWAVENRATQDQAP